MEVEKLDGGLSALTDVLGDDFNNAEERYLLEMLAILRESYEKMTKPYIDRLVSIRSMRPTAPMLVTRQQAEALGLLPPNATVQATARQGRSPGTTG